MLHAKHFQPGYIESVEMQHADFLYTASWRHKIPYSRYTTLEKIKKQKPTYKLEHRQRSMPIVHTKITQNANI